jgi:hypothetical protein
MKRARKTRMTHDIASRSLDEESILWASFASDQHELDTELDWVRSCLELHFKVGLTNIHRSSSVESQVIKCSGQMGDGGVASRVFVTSRYRNDDVTQLVDSFKTHFPQSAIYCILGQWWVGHKRTLPLPAAYSVFYWYQLYDLLLPETKLARQSASLLDSEAMNPVRAESALVLASDPEMRRMWGDSLNEMGIHSVALMDFASIPESDFSYVLVDADSQFASFSNMNKPSTDLLPSLLPNLVQVLRKRYPRSIIAVFSGFPEWPSGQALLLSGANIIAGKPCRFAGLVSSLRSKANR